MKTEHRSEQMLIVTGNWKRTPWWLFWKPKHRRLVDVIVIGLHWDYWEYDDFGVALERSDVDRIKAGDHTNPEP
jgi:hypothetical protein